MFVIILKVRNKNSQQKFLKVTMHWKMYSLGEGEIEKMTLKTGVTKFAFY